jgi:hypothetical protein
LADDFKKFKSENIENDNQSSSGLVGTRKLPSPLRLDERASSFRTRAARF